MSNPIDDPFQLDPFAEPEIDPFQREQEFPFDEPRYQQLPQTFQPPPELEEPERDPFAELEQFPFDEPQYPQLPQTFQEEEEYDEDLPELEEGSYIDRVDYVIENLHDIKKINIDEYLFILNEELNKLTLDQYDRLIDLQRGVDPETAEELIENVIAHNIVTDPDPRDIEWLPSIKKSSVVKPNPRDIEWLEDEPIIEENKPLTKEELQRIMYIDDPEIEKRKKYDELKERLIRISESGRKSDEERREREYGPSDISFLPDEPKQKRNVMYNRIIGVKQEEWYPKEVTDEIDLMTVGNNMDTNVYGSYAFRVQKYPSDIDLIENYSSHNTKEKIISNFVRDIAKVVKNIKSKKIHYYSELKAGIDKRYAFPIGVMNDGKFSLSSSFQTKISNLYRNDLLTKEDFTILHDIAIRGKTQPLTADDYDVVGYILRKYKIVRWKADEVLKGYKYLNGGVKLTLAEAVTHPTIVKLDEITFINDQITEVTNMYQFQYYDRETDQFVPFGYVDNYNSLQKEIEKLYYSNLWYNPFKAIKRIFSWCRHIRTNECVDISNILAELFHSDSAQLYQINSRLNTLHLLLNLTPNPPWVNIANQILKIYFDIFNNLRLSKYAISDMIPILTKMVDASKSKALGSKKKNFLQKALSTLSEYLSKKINSSAVFFINKNNLLEILNPHTTIYDTSLRRSSQSEPINPLDKYKSITGGCLECGGICGGFFESD